MLYINECLTSDTPVKLVNANNKKSLFEKKEPKTYFKKFNHAEFIGEELCSIKNIRCAHYFIAGLTQFKINKTLSASKTERYYPVIGIGSQDFKESNKIYKSIRDYEVRANNGFESMLENAHDEENKKQLCRDMLEMLALDIYMGQADRSEVNIMFEEDENGNIRLAPLYDFEHSLNSTCMNSNYLHSSALYSFKNIDGCREFIRKYPMFREILSSYLDVDLAEVISRSYNSRGLVVPSDKWGFYLDFDQKQKEKIKSIVK